jgi:arsenite methyltransferase
MDKPTPIHDAVREHYASRARVENSCCDTSECCGSDNRIYPVELLADLPEDIANFSLGCGDPITLAELKTGQVVLDLGSGGGLDCFLAAKKVGESGRVIGVDMTPEMIARARANAERLGAANVEFRQGYLEDLPLEESSIDVVISNCVINLSPDKSRVFREIFRVLKPGGRIAVSDIVTNGQLPEALRNDMDAWGACVSGALDMRDYERNLNEAGFVTVNVQAKNADGKLLSVIPIGIPFSASITAFKPA